MSDGFLSITDQVARHLEDRVRSGYYTGLMPGRDRLVAELGVSGKTVEIALKRLEELGLLETAGAGRRRRIVAQPKESRRRLRVVILPYETADRGLGYVVDLQHRLAKAGHAAEFAPANLVGLEISPGGVAGFVRQNPADAWILMGASLEVLQWFEGQKIPAFALFGRRRTVNLAGAGPNKLPAMREVVDRLCSMGHRRIALICRSERRKPYPGATEQAFLDGLTAHGITPGSYHLPGWEATPSGFRQCLDSLFALTPPTALILDEAYQYMVAREYLARRGLPAPEQISLVCNDPDPWFEWYWPPPSHISWDPDPVIRRIVRWVKNVASGREDRRQVEVKAVFVEGGTVGPAPGSGGTWS